MKIYKKNSFAFPNKQLSKHSNFREREKERERERNRREGKVNKREIKRGIKIYLNFNDFYSRNHKKKE